MLQKHLGSSIIAPDKGVPFSMRYDSIGRPERQKGLWSYLTWSFFLAQATAMSGFFSGQAEASESAAGTGGSGAGADSSNLLDLGSRWASGGSMSDGEPSIGNAISESTTIVNASFEGAGNATIVNANPTFADQGAVQAVAVTENATFVSHVGSSSPTPTNPDPGHGVDPPDTHTPTVPGGEDPSGPIGVIIDPIIDIVENVVDDVVVPVVEVVGDIVEGVVTPVVEIVGDVLEGVVTPVVEVVGDVLEGVVTPVVEIVGDVVEGVVAPVVGLVGEVVENVVAPVTTLVGGVVEDVVAPVVETVSDVLAPVVDVVEDVVAPVTTLVGGVVEDVVAPVVGTVGDLVGSLLGPVADVVENIADAAAPAVEPITGLVTEVADAAAPLLDAVDDLPPSPLDLGQLLAATGDIVPDLGIDLAGLLGGEPSSPTDGGAYTNLSLAMHTELDETLSATDLGINVDANGNEVDVDLAHVIGVSTNENLQIDLAINGTGLNLSLFGNNGLL